MKLIDFIDLDRYPIDQPKTAEYSDLVQLCQKELDAEGMFNLAGILREDIAWELSEALLPKFQTEAFTHSRMHNIYFQKEVAGVPPHHPCLIPFETTNHTLCTDQLSDTLLGDLYQSSALARFLADVMGKPKLYPMADPLAGLNAMAYYKGEALNWHFDRSEFTTTLLLQAPENGGDFQYRKDLRSEDNPNFEGVARMLAGEDDELRTLVQSVGTLNVFRGKNTAHRVTPVAGNRARIIAVFSFFEEPNRSFSTEERVGFYGRSA